MSDFSTYTADQVADWMSQGTIASAPTDLYVAVFDDTGTERSGDFLNDRVQTSAGTDWDFIDAEETNFENANNIDFGEATTDVNSLQEVAIYDDTLSNGGNEIARYDMNNTPFDVADGSKLVFQSGDLEFDVVQRT